MSDLLARAAGLLVAPAPERVLPVVRALAPARIAVLGRPDHVLALAAAAGLGHPGPVCVAVWGGGGRTAPATRAAARLAARLAAHGLPATSAGRLAWVELADEAQQAAAQWERVCGWLDVPAVLALARPRDPAFEPALAEIDEAVVALPEGVDPALAALAVTSLAVPVRLSGPVAALLRPLALAGLFARPPAEAAPVPCGVRGPG